MNLKVILCLMFPVLMALAIEEVSVSTLGGPLFLYILIQIIPRLAYFQMMKADIQMSFLMK